MAARSTCEATTKDGDRCKNPTWRDTSFCYTHRDRAKQAGQDVEANWWERVVGWVEASKRRVWWFGLGAFLLGSTVVLVGLYSDLTGRPLLEPFLGATATATVGQAQEDNSTVAASPTPDRYLYNVEIAGLEHKVIVAYNAARQPLWQKEFDTQLCDVVLDDLDQDGEREIVTATHEPGPSLGWIYVLDEAGTLIASLNTWKPSIYYGCAKPQMNVSRLKVVDLTGDGMKEIVTFSGDTYWYAGRLQVSLLNEGELLEVGEYWNPGLPKQLHIEDLNNDAIYEIICVAENNDLQSVTSLGGNVFTVFLLSGEKVSGQAPPWSGDASRGTEIWYGYVSPASVGIRELDFEDIDGNGEREVQVTLSDACSYYLSLEGNLLGRGRGTGCQDESELHIIPGDL